MLQPGFVIGAAFISGQHLLKTAAAVYAPI
jgi:hypothetical protein